MLASPFHRFAIAMPLAIACIVGAVFYPLYREAERTIRDEVHGAIEQEILSLDDHFHEKGIDALVSELRARVASPIDPNAVYLLTDAEGGRMAGNLDAWPETIEPRDDAWFRVADGPRGAIEGKVFVLFHGEQLLVGRRSPLAEFRRSMLLRMWLSAALIIAATWLIVAAFMRHLHRRLERMADEAGAIRQGHLSRRLSVGPRHDELDLLAVRFNEAFDEIETLVDAARHVSSALAHDMRRPLIRLRQSLEATLAAEPQNTALAASLAPLLEQTELLLQRFGALLRLARLEAGTLTPAAECFRVDQVLRDAVELYNAPADAAGRSIALDAAEMTIAGDRHLLFQLVQNLLENALAHGDGAIDVCLAGADGRLMLSVRDHGSGVPSNLLDRLFERFFQVDPSRGDDRSAGIGLAMVRAIAHALGGTVSAEAAAPGLRVVVSLPAGTMPGAGN